MTSRQVADDAGLCEPACYWRMIATRLELTPPPPFFFLFFYFYILFHTASVTVRFRGGVAPNNLNLALTKC